MIRSKYFEQWFRVHTNREHTYLSELSLVSETSTTTSVNISVRTGSAVFVSRLRQMRERFKIYC